MDLVKKVRLGLTNTQFIRDDVMDHRHVAENDKCLAVITDLLTLVHDWEMIPQGDEEMPSREFARPRIPHEILFANGRWGGGFHTDYFLMYDTRANRQDDVDEVDLTSQRAYHGTAFSGFNGIVSFNFNAVAKTWRVASPMHICRRRVRVAVMAPHPQYSSEA
jgi:kelch-like protein 10